MKEITMYECEICKEAYRDKEKAIACEQKGKEIPLIQVGETVQYEMQMGGGFSPFYVKMRIIKIKDDGHSLKYYTETYDEEDKEWVQSSMNTTAIWGNREFEKLCKAE